jgi:hypothetical protein
MDLIKNYTWILMELSHGKKPITDHWVYKIKPNLNKKLDKLKARCIVRGFEQKKGVDFEETFAHNPINTCFGHSQQMGKFHLDMCIPSW